MGGKTGNPLTAISEWYSKNANTYELIFKVILTGEIGLSIVWFCYFVWFESFGPTTAGMMEARLLLLLTAIGHAPVPATLLWAVERIPKGKLKWTNLWWLVFALLLDIAVTVDAFIHLPHAPSGITPDNVRGVLMAQGILLCCIATASIVIYIIAMNTQTDVTPSLPTVLPSETGTNSSLRAPLMYKPRTVIIK